MQDFDEEFTASPFPMDSARDQGVKSLLEGEVAPLQISGLASLITSQFETNKDDRQDIEREMLECLQYANCEYDNVTQSQIDAIGGSDVYIPLISQQISSGSAWVSSILMPTGNNSSVFSLDATPIPDIPESVRSEIEEELKEKIKQTFPQQDGVPIGPNGPVQPEQVKELTEVQKQEVEKELVKEAKRRASKMERKISDQMVDSEFNRALGGFIDHLMTFHNAFLETSYKTKTKGVTTKGEDGSLTMMFEEELVEYDEVINPLDVFPSPDQTDINNGALIIRKKMTRKSLQDMIGVPSYNEESIRKILEDKEQYSNLQWQTNIDSDRKDSEGHSSSYLHDNSIYGLRYLGPACGRDIKEWSLGAEFENLEDDLDYEIDALLVGNYIVKVILNDHPEGKRNIYTTSFRKVAGSFWGKSPALLGANHQRMVNACARALSNNMAISSGPMVMMYIDRLPQGEDIDGLHPWKIFQMTSDPSGANNVPIQFFQPNSNSNELMGVYQSFFDTIGDVTGIPKISFDQAGINYQTATGATLLFDAASKQIKKAIYNISKDVIEPRVKDQYYTNMLDPEIDASFKGDFCIQVNGTGMMERTVENQRLIELLQGTANPMDQGLLGPKGRAAMWRTIASNNNIHGMIPSEEEIDQMQKQAMEAQANQQQAPTPEQVKLQIEQVRAQTRIQDQELENKNAEAERQVRLQIAQMELQAKQMDLEVKMAQSQLSKEQQEKVTLMQQESAMKLQALKELNANSRHKDKMLNE